jgi:hypothetical protein
VLGVECATVGPRARRRQQGGGNGVGRGGCRHLHLAWGRSGPRQAPAGARTAGGPAAAAAAAAAPAAAAAAARRPPAAPAWPSRAARARRRRRLCLLAGGKAAYVSAQRERWWASEGACTAALSMLSAAPGRGGWHVQNVSWGPHLAFEPRTAAHLGLPLPAPHSPTRAWPRDLRQAMRSAKLVQSLASLKYGELQFSTAM